MDVAASEFFKDGKYDLDFKNPNSDSSKWLTGEQLAELYQSFIKEYPVVSIEDGFDQDDWENWIKLQSATSIQLVGDDLTVTNPKRIKTAVEKKACNCLLLKVNQIGSVTESIEASTLSRQNGWGVMVSHRSGETEDTFSKFLIVMFENIYINSFPTFQLLILLLALQLVKSKLVLLVALNEQQSTINSSVLKKNLVMMRFMQVKNSVILKPKKFNGTSYVKEELSTTI